MAITWLYHFPVELYKQKSTHEQIIKIYVDMYMCIHVDLLLNNRFGDRGYGPIPIQKLAI